MQNPVHTRNRGFTLIELLVVIAIIGMLAAIVLASLGTARSKGVAAAVQSQLDSARSAAEVFATNHNNSYLNLCSDANFGAIVTAAGKPTNVSAYCNSSATAWVLEAATSTGVSTSGWCVDSTGAAKSEPTFFSSASPVTQC